MSRLKSRRPRVFVGLVEVAGYYEGLVSGLRELDIPVSHVNIFENEYYSCPPAHGSWIVGISNALTKMFHRTQKRRATRWLFRPVRWIHLTGLFMWAVVRHDVFIFSFGSSFFSLRDLPLYKILGKRLIFVFSGSDSRPPYLSGLYIAEPSIALPRLAVISADSKRRLRKIEKYAQFCVNHALSAQFHEKPFVNFLKMGNPSRADIAPVKMIERIPAEEQVAAATVRILHAPSRPILKGSAKFARMIARMKADGRAIEYIELRKRPHREVLEEIAGCDIVLDELYSDTTLAALGTEAASFGKPALVGGYGGAALHAASQGLPLPFDTYCRPQDVETVLLRLIMDRDWRIACGEKAKQFVIDYWQPKMIAEKFLRLIHGDVPGDWMFDPQEITYFHGWGVSEDQLRLKLGELIAFAGVGALQLADKPGLQSAIVEFVHEAFRPAPAANEKALFVDGHA